MALHRWLAALPLATAVAFLAHAAGFGADHAPGAEHVQALGLWLLGALMLCLAGAFLAGLFARSDRDIATRRPDGYRYGLLAAGGLIALAIMEASEGHLELAPGTIRSLAALVPSALLVLACARAFGSVAARAGRLLASALAILGTAGRCNRSRIGRSASPIVHRALARATLGRAPPAAA